MHVSPEFYEKLDRFFGTEPGIARNCRAVAEYLEATSPEKLKMISFVTLAQILGKTSIDDDVVRIATILSTSACHLLRKKWMFLDVETGDEYELAGEEVKALMLDGQFTHPETGKLVEDAGSQIYPFFEPAGLIGE